MARKFSMKKIIKKDSITLKVVKKGGSLVKGNWVKGSDVTYTFDGAPFNLTAREINQYDSGRYTSQDAAFDVPDDYILYDDLDQGTTEKITNNDKIIWTKSGIEYNYKVQDIQDETTHSDYFEFICKKVAEDES